MAKTKVLTCPDCQTRVTVDADEEETGFSCCATQFDDQAYGLSEDTHGFRKKVREALEPVKQLMDDCEEIWSPIGDGISYVRGMAIA